MNQINLEPAYLRYIYDGLINGSIHPENAAELPDGLIGLYEEAFDEKQPVHLRQQLLERFAIWALLKKEVSAQFVAEVLNQPDEEIQEFISTYSSWFNSPESGKYQLYHERLKVYLLQKLSANELDLLHARLIEKLESALNNSSEEFEVYTLAFLAQHYCIDSLKNGNGEKLISFCYDQSIWKRQIEKSKSYLWTRSALLSLMTWASKYSDEEVEDCCLKLLVLNNLEQSSGNQIIKLAQIGEIDLALIRISEFGSNDAKGLQKKFILYMLLLIEFTLLESSAKEISNMSIEKVLTHLDQNFLKDTSILSWSKFFPTKLLFEIAFELQNLGQDPLILFDFSDDWDEEVYLGFKSLTTGQISLVEDAITKLPSLKNKIKHWVYFSKCLHDLGDHQKAIELIQIGYDSIPDLSEKIQKESLHLIASISNKIKLKDLSLLVLANLDDICVQMKPNYLQHIEHKKIALKYAELGEHEKFEDIIRKYDSVQLKIEALTELSNIYINRGDEFEAKKTITHALNLLNGFNKISLRTISIYVGILEMLIELRLDFELKSTLADFKNVISSLEDESLKFQATTMLNKFYLNKKEFDQVIQSNKQITDSFWKSKGFEDIAVSYARINDVEKSLFYLNEISDKSDRMSCKRQLIKIFSEKNFVKEAIALARQYDAYDFEPSPYLHILNDFSEKGEIEATASIYYSEFLNPKTELGTVQKVNFIQDLIENLIQKDEFQSAELAIDSLNVIEVDLYLKLSRKVNDKGNYDLSKHLIEKSIELVTHLNDEQLKASQLREIILHFCQIGKHHEAVKLFDQENYLPNWKANIFSMILRNYTDQISELQISELELRALDIRDELHEPLDKVYYLLDLAEVFSIWNLNNKSTKYLNEASQLIDEFDKERPKNMALSALIKTLVKLENLEEAVKVLGKFTLDLQKRMSLKHLAESLAHSGRFQEAKLLANEISNEGLRMTTHLSIATNQVRNYDIKSEFLLEQIFEDESLKVGGQLSSRSLSDIAFVAYKLHSKELAFSYSFKIDDKSTRISLWKQIENYETDIDQSISLFLADQFNNEEAREFYRKSWLENRPLNFVSKKEFSSVRHLFLHDLEMLQLLLYKYALNKIFSSNHFERKSAFNEVLDLNWASELKQKIAC